MRLHAQNTFQYDVWCMNHGQVFLKREISWWSLRMMTMKVDPMVMFGNTSWQHNIILHVWWSLPSLSDAHVVLLFVWFTIIHTWDDSVLNDLDPTCLDSPSSSHALPSFASQVCWRWWSWCGAAWDTDHRQHQFFCQKVKFIFLLFFVWRSSF